MRDAKEKQKEDISMREVAGRAGAGALAGFTMGSMAAGPLVGLAFALIWGVQSAIHAASGKSADASDVT